MRLQMVQSLKELYRQPDCWEKTSAPIVRFWTGDGSCWGFPYFSVITTRYEPEAERLLIYFGTGAIVIQGPGMMEFFDDFANQRATGLKSDGKEITSVEIDLPRESQP
jgi:hypothetical protein